MVLQLPTQVTKRVPTKLQILSDSWPEQFIDQEGARKGTALELIIFHIFGQPAH